jgi:hypothetical protein
MKCALMPQSIVRGKTLQIRDGHQLLSNSRIFSSLYEDSESLSLVRKLSLTNLTAMVAAIQRKLDRATNPNHPHLHVFQTFSPIYLPLVYPTFFEICDLCGGLPVSCENHTQESRTAK